MKVSSLSFLFVILPGGSAFQPLSVTSSFRPTPRFSTTTPAEAATEFDVMKYITDKLPAIEKALDESIVSKEKETEKIVEAMKYSLMAGGKRIRPVLCLAACEMFNNGDFSPAMPAAVSLEMVRACR